MTKRSAWAVAAILAGVLAGGCGSNGGGASAGGGVGGDRDRPDTWQTMRQQDRDMDLQQIRSKQGR